MTLTVRWTVDDRDWVLDARCWTRIL